MTPYNHVALRFYVWLQGYFEISDSNNLSPQQVQIIRDHLALVFEKVTPDRNIKKYNPQSTLDAFWEDKTGTLKKEETRYC